MGRTSIIPELEKKIGGGLKEYLTKKIDSGMNPQEIATDLEISKSLAYELINFYELKDRLKQVRKAQTKGVVNELAEQWDLYIRDKEIANFSERTIAKTKDQKRLYLWWINHTNRVPNIEMGLSKEYLTEFMYYLSTETQRWGATTPQGPMNPRSVIGYRKGLAALIAWLIKHDRMEKDPLKTMFKPKLEKRMVEDIPDEVIAKVLSQMGDNSFTEIRDKAIVYMFLETGMRLGGVSSLKAEGFNLETGWGRIWEKGNKERAIKLTTRLKAQLSRYLEIRSPIAKVKALWINQDGSALTAATIGQIIRKLNDLPGVRDSIELLAPGNRIHPHIFRHIWAKHMAQADIPIQAIQVMGGWDTIELVMYYAKAYSHESAWAKIDAASPLGKIESGSGGA